jgi:CubicO group peptidase (beta-lactamase class C family)
LPSYYSTDFATGEFGRREGTGPDLWTVPPVFPAGAAGLLSTIDDYLAFARLLLAKGVYQERRILSEESVEQMTGNQLTAEQISGGGVLLNGLGWGFGLAVSVKPDEVSDVPGYYGWSGGYGTVWFNDPNRELIAIAMTQTSDFLFNGSADEFSRLAERTVAG